MPVLTARFHHPLYKDIENLKQKMDMEDCIVRIQKKGKWSERSKPNSIELSYKWIEIYNQTPEVVLFVAACEMVHYKYKEFQKKALSEAFVMFFDEMKASRLLRDMRGIIEAAYVLELSEESLLHTLKILKAQGELYTEKSFQGFPDSGKIAGYCSDARTLTKDKAQVILSDYCKKTVPQNPDALISNVMNDFFSS
ncbi:hypothetical protein [Bacillus sp. 1P06AnD]|uniref:hypothetical protein n=1 Tax=Bacillus sp. 1P06AnD TaxID=3132208 RepID=UPI0039A24EEC